LDRERHAAAQRVGGLVMSSAKPWYHAFFTDFRPLFGIVPARTTNAQATYIIKKLGLKRGAQFLDCPCGVGRISIPLARRGIRVTGVDLTKEYLDDLQREARKRRLRIDTLHADMRRISYQNRFDAVANLWTSFGYFEREQDNVLVVKQAFHALKPGGKFLLHVINRDFIIAHYTDTDWFEHAGVISFESRKFDYTTSINRGVWRFFKNGETHTHKVDIRMYSYHELVTMFQKIGFVDIQGFGSIKETPIDSTCRMMWIVGTKPRRK
jgi:SAM-dependent methyltransferase